MPFLTRPFNYSNVPVPLAFVSSPIIGGIGNAGSKYDASRPNKTLNLIYHLLLSFLLVMFQALFKKDVCKIMPYHVNLLRISAKSLIGLPSSASIPTNVSNFAGFRFMAFPTSFNTLAV